MVFRCSTYISAFPTNSPKNVVVGDFPHLSFQLVPAMDLFDSLEELQGGVMDVRLWPEEGRN